MMQYVGNRYVVPAAFSIQKRENDCDIPAVDATCPLKTPRGPEKTSSREFGKCEDGMNAAL